MRTSPALVLLAAMAVHAEENCGRMDRYATRFDGTVQSVDGREPGAIIVPNDEKDARYAVKVQVAGLKKDDLALRNGAVLDFGVHSPARTFGDAEVVGKTYALIAVWLACDGELRRFEDLLVAGSRPVHEYDGDGWLRVGWIYRGAAVGRDPDPVPVMPRHHSGGIAWTNAEEFLPEDEQRRTVVFEITKQWIQHQGEMTWVNVLSAKILSAEPAK